MQHSKPLKNAIWIIGCRVIQSVLSLGITMLTARYYGPSNYGLINYAASVVAFVEPIMQLGLNTILVQELIAHQNEQGKTLGTVIGLNLISSVICVTGVACFSAAANSGEKDTIIVCVLYSLILPVQALEMIQYWFQAELKAKYTSITSLIAYIFVSAYKLFLLITGKHVYWFAVSQALDHLIISVVLLLIYRKSGGQSLSFSGKMGRRLLTKSKYYIISAMMITVFAQTDKIMLKMIAGQIYVGYYSAAVTCAGMTAFVFSAIIDTARPVILEAKKLDENHYRQYGTILYSLIIFISLVQSIVLTVFAKLVVRILYGAEYMPAVPVLRILVWYTIFSYFGGARSVWILAEEKHSVLWKVNLCGAVANVLLNMAMIPSYGAEGAAIASLVTQAFTNVGIWFLIPELKENNRWLWAALNPKYLLNVVKRFWK